MKQVFHNKGGSGDRTGQSATSIGSSSTSSHGTELRAVSHSSTTEAARRLPASLTRWPASSQLPEPRPSWSSASVPTGQTTGGQPRETERLQARMIALQEELDWHCYRLYGLIGRTTCRLRRRTTCPSSRSASGRSRSSWPGRWRPASCRRRGSSGTARPRSPRSRRTGPTPTGRSSSGGSTLIETNPNIAPDRAARVQAALEPRAVGRAGAACAADVAARPAGSPTATGPTRRTAARADLRAALADAASARRRVPAGGRALSRAGPTSTWRRWSTELVAAEAVPFLPVLRYKPSGLRKRAGLGADLGPPARARTPGEDVGRRSRCRRSTRRPTSRRPTTGGCGASSTCPRSGSSATRTARRDGDPIAGRRLGRLGPPAAGARPWPPTTTPSKDAEGWDAERLTPLLAGLDSSCCPGCTSGTTRSTPSSAPADGRRTTTSFAGRTTPTRSA